jgi:hypothetical protein
MRRSIAPLVVVAALAAVVAPAGGATRSGGILCPLSASTCCGPPTAARDAIPCCVTATCCPPTAARDVAAMCLVPLTITASPNPSVEGREVVISGRLGAAANSGVTVTLSERAAGAAGFSPVATGVTGASGTYSITRTDVRTNRSWYVTAGGETSITVAQQVAASVTIRRTHRFVLSGVVRPAQTKATVSIQQRTAGGWQTVAQAPLRGGSAYKLAFRSAHRAVVRALWVGDARNSAATSRAVAVPAS